LPTQELADKLDQIRDGFGYMIELDCAARCPSHNIAVGGAPHSLHVLGYAADLKYTPPLSLFLVNMLERLDIYMEDPKATPTWRHVQTRAPASGKRIFEP
jgi:hypothetical protein